MRDTAKRPAVSRETLDAVVAALAISGPLLQAEPLRRGHIHETFIVTCSGGQRYLVQRLSTVVLPNPEPVLRLNLEADTEALMIEKRDALLARIEAG